MYENNNLSYFKNNTAQKAFKKKTITKRGSRGAVQVEISMRWSVNQLIACLYKDN